MKRLTLGFLFVAVAVLAVAGGYFARLWLAGPEPQRDAGAVLLAAALPDLDGRVQPIAQWKGQVVVVNFWATWCPPCVKEIPELVRMQARYGPRGAQFVGIAIDDKAKVADFVRRFEMNYPSLVAEAAGIDLARAAGNRLGGLPFTVVIDRQGRAAKVELGTVTEKSLSPLLESLL